MTDGERGSGAPVRLPIGRGQVLFFKPGFPVRSRKGAWKNRVASGWLTRKGGWRIKWPCLPRTRRAHQEGSCVTLAGDRLPSTLFGCWTSEIVSLDHPLPFHTTIMSAQTRCSAPPARPLKRTARGAGETVQRYEWPARRPCPRGGFGRTSIRGFFPQRRLDES